MTCTDVIARAQEPRTGGGSAGRSPALLALLLTLGLAWGCRSGATRVSVAGASGVAGLLDGPTRWLMLPDEDRRARRLSSTREAIAFIEEFWRRRDPDPATPGNDFSRVFYERVDAADRLYSEEGKRGSLTDHGRALVLLGPPPVLRYAQKRVPAFDTSPSGQLIAGSSRTQQLETWVYTAAQLPPGLLALLGDEPPEEISIAFVTGPRNTYLVEGEKYLELAARAAVRDAPE
ncbi:MAG TPA: GWxTD domain-containing protein [Thermoanaerobaculia bacterium]|nr:GWxTD domain-containing protein [Thermoanaerobaculia bacterium]